MTSVTEKDILKYVVIRHNVFVNYFRVYLYILSIQSQNKYCKIKIKDHVKMSDKVKY